MLRAYLRTGPASSRAHFPEGELSKTLSTQKCPSQRCCADNPRKHDVPRPRDAMRVVTRRTTSTPPHHLSRHLQHSPAPSRPPQVGVSPFPGQKALLQQQPLAWLQHISFHPGYPSSPALATVLLRQCETRGHQVPSCFEPESEPEALVTTRNRCCCCGRACGQSHFSASASLMALFFLKCTCEVHRVGVCAVP